MAGFRLTLKRLYQKYNIPLSGTNYSNLVGEIIQDNVVRAQKAAHGVSNRRYMQAARQAVAEGSLKMPEYAVGIPTVRKSAEAGQQITDTIRDRLTRGLRETIAEGGTDVEQINRMVQSVHETMEPYTKRMNPMSVPAYCKTIAVTEVRSATDLAKWEYAQEFSKRNNLRMIINKRWRHQDHLVKTPRPNHKALHGVTVDLNTPFSLNTKHGIIPCMYPHEPNLPAEEVINCQCTWDLLTTVPEDQIQKSVERRTAVMKDLEFEVEKLGDLRGQG